MTPVSDASRVGLFEIAREWGRIGVIGVGGPPAHIALLRDLVVTRRRWMDPEEFEHAIAAANLLPGPASTHLMIFAAWRLRGWRGAVVGGVCFIVPGLVMILALAAIFFSRDPSPLVRGAALGAGAVVPAIAARTAAQLAGPSRATLTTRAARWRWALYLVVGAAVALAAPALVAGALLACGASEVLLRRRASPGPLAMGVAAHAPLVGGLGALAWVAFKVGALSYGGGFVIVPLMQHDVVNVEHWMSGAQFLNVVALGQITPGPVVLTVSAVGYGAHRLSGALLATLIAFAPSFVFVLVGGRHFERLRTNESVRAFLAGAGPSVIGAIAASSIALANLLSHLWQVPILLAGVLWLFALRRSAPLVLVGGALAGAALSGHVPL